MSRPTLRLLHAAVARHPRPSWKQPATFRRAYSSTEEGKGTIPLAAPPSETVKAQVITEDAPKQVVQDNSPILEKPHSSTSTRPSSPTSVQIEELKERLRILAQDTAIALRQRGEHFTSLAIKNFAQLGRELNKVTGYQEIEVLKRRVVEQEQKIKTARTRAHTTKATHTQCALQRSTSQREVNDLLSRKSSWTDTDVSRFTSLVRQDHLYEQQEAEAKVEMDKAEEEVDKEFSELMRVILERYHEEQVWSDKIRSASTYGQLTVLGLNMLVFILAIILVEPWKRKRLAQTFERKVEEMSAETIGAFETKTNELQREIEGQTKLVTELIESISYAMQPGYAAQQEASFNDGPIEDVATAVVFAEEAKEKGSVDRIPMEDTEQLEAILNPEVCESPLSIPQPETEPLPDKKETIFSIPIPTSISLPKMPELTPETAVTVAVTGTITTVIWLAIGTWFRS